MAWLGADLDGQALFVMEAALAQLVQMSHASLVPPAATLISASHVQVQLACNGSCGHASSTAICLDLQRAPFASWSRHAPDAARRGSTAGLIRHSCRQRHRVRATGGRTARLVGKNMMYHIQAFFFFYILLQNSKCAFLYAPL